MIFKGCLNNRLQASCVMSLNRDFLFKKTTSLNARDRKTQLENNGEGNGAEILHPYKKSVGHITKSNIFGCKKI